MSWVKEVLGSVCDVQSGSGFPEAYQGIVDGKYPFYKVSDMNLPGNETAMKSANNSISESVRHQLGAKLFPPGSILFPKVGGAIATNKKRLALTECCVDNNIMGLIPNNENVLPAFMFYYMQTINIYEFSNKPIRRRSASQRWSLGR